VTLKSLKKFVQSVEKKYGKKALKMRVEVHHPLDHNGQKFSVPADVAFLGVATYKADEEWPEEKVVVIK
jgi:hypothetical protein